MDLEQLGPAVLVDSSALVVDSNQFGRGWLNEDGSAPISVTDSSLRASMPSPTCRWIERIAPDGSTVRALMTIVPQPGGGALLLFAEPPELDGAKLSTSHMQATLDSLPAMIGYWDRELRNRFANRAYVEWFATTPEQMFGRHIKDLLGPELFEKNRPYMEGALRGQAQHFERTIPRPDGLGFRHSNASYIPDIRDGHVAGFSVLVADVTELKTTQAALKAARDELEQRVVERTAALEQANGELSRSNAELEQFAHIASHDLQEPLRTVANYCELLQERYGERLDERADRYLRYVLDGSRRMQGLVQALLTVSRVGGVRRQRVPTDPEQSARLAVAALQLRIEETAAEVRISPMPRVSADPQELIRVFQNLIANSLKFKSSLPPRVDIKAKRLENFLEISVTDNGIGIDPEQAQDIFRMFYRARTGPTHEGSGIGLAVAKKIVEGHGGAIGVRSTAGEGATVWFTLPLTVDCK